MEGNKQNILIGVVVILLLGSVFASPYWTVNQIKSAAKHNDPKALAQYIDFPSIKESLKSQINGLLVKEVTKEGKSGGFEALGAAMATAFVGPVIDAFVTPENLTMMMQGKNVKLGETSTEHASKDQAVNENSHTNVEMGYESYDRFNVDVSAEKDPSKKISFTLKREGLWSWKVATLTMPIPEEKKEVVVEAAMPAQVEPEIESQAQSNQETDNEFATPDAQVAPEIASESASDNVASVGAVPESVESVAAKPSFDCTKASSINEHLICDDPELAKLDTELFAVYKLAKQATNNAAWFKESTRTAFKWREANCQDKACLLSWYSERKMVLSKIAETGGSTE